MNDNYKHSQHIGAHQDRVQVNLLAMDFLVKLGYSEGEALMLITESEVIDQVAGLPREVVGMFVELKELEAKRQQDEGDHLDKRLLAVDIDLLWFMTVCKLNGHIQKENTRRERAADNGEWHL